MRKDETVREAFDPRRVAAHLHWAHRGGLLLEADAVFPQLSLTQAYAVQDGLTALREAEGRVRAGYKLGYTSDAMRRQMGIDTPNYGPLFADMIVSGGGPTFARFIQPRVEPEIALVLGADLVGPEVSIEQVAAAVVEVRASLEIVDSVWKDYRFTLAHNTADGSSAAGVVLGPTLDVSPLQCDRAEVVLYVGDQQVATATGAAASGHPLRGAAWLCSELYRRHGTGLRAGEVVMSGGLTAAFALAAGGRVTATFGSAAVVEVSR